MTFLYKSDNFINQSILFSLVLLLFLHFIKEEFIFYYPLLIAAYTLGVFQFLKNQPVKINQTPVFNVYLIFICYSIFVVIWTLTFYSVEGNYIKFNFFQYFNASARLLLMPLLVVSIYSLIIKKDNFFKLQIFFVIACCIGSLSMMLQQFVGGINMLGHYGAPRFMGLHTYPSTLGNITIYGSVVGLAILITLMNDKIKFFFKSIIFSILFLGVFLTMQKSALVNLVIVLTFISIFNFKNTLKILGLSIILMSIVFIIFPEIITNIFSLITNTFGIKISGVTKAGIYLPIFDLFMDRQFEWFNEPKSFIEFLFGWGLPGGSDALGYTFITQPGFFAIGTTHNQYLDLFQIGGIFLILIFLAFLIFVNLELISRWIINKDETSKVFFLCNIIFAINCTVANGILFHPIASFIFWISVCYVLMPYHRESTLL